MEAKNNEDPPGLKPGVPLSSDPSGRNPARFGRRDKIRLLLVDDEEIIREVLGYMLEKRGFAVRTAQDGRDALEKIVREAPDIIVLDVTMPVMDGYELCRLLRGNPATRGIPVIFLSAQRRRDEIISAMAAGAAIEYIEKPCDLAYLITKINTLTAGKPP